MDPLYERYPNLRPEPESCGKYSGHFPVLADFPCVRSPGHEGPHRDRHGYCWNLDGSRLKATKQDARVSDG